MDDEPDPESPAAIICTVFAATLAIACLFAAARYGILVMTSDPLLKDAWLLRAVALAAGLLVGSPLAICGMLIARYGSVCTVAVIALAVLVLAVIGLLAF